MGFQNMVVLDLNFWEPFIEICSLKENLFSAMHIGSAEGWDFFFCPVQRLSLWHKVWTVIQQLEKERDPKTFTKASSWQRPQRQPLPRLQALGEDIKAIISASDTALSPSSRWHSNHSAKDFRGLYTFGLPRIWFENKPREAEPYVLWDSRKVEKGGWMEEECKIF